MSVSLGEGWNKGVTVHTGSKPGKGGENGDFTVGKYMINAYELGFELPQAGFKTVAYGDGVAGTMGAVAHGAVAGGADVTGVTLDFFAKEQGAGIEGAKPSIITKDMPERMGSTKGMRSITHSAISLPGSLGTCEEKFEWTNSRNLFVYPQVVVNLDGFFDPSREFLHSCAARGFSNRKNDVKRLYFEQDNDYAIERLLKLDAEPPTAEIHETQTKGRVEDYVEETKHSMIVQPNPLNVMYQVLARLVSYDVANIPGQTLFQSEGNIIKPAIFVGDHFAGFEKQLRIIFNEEFMPREREQFLLFAPDTDTARDMAHELDKEEPLTPDNLKERHAEYVQAALLDPRID